MRGSARMHTSPPRHRSRANAAIGLIGLNCSGLLIAASSSLAADDTETGPDPFHTQQEMHRGASGLNDPLGYTCATPARRLTFAAAVDLALCANPQTRSAWAQAHQQAAVLGQAESAWLPQISATGSGTRQFGPHADVNGNITDSAQNTGDAAANLTWTLYDFGGRTGRIENARDTLASAAATANSVVQQTVRSVAQTYYGSVADDALLVAAKSAEDIS